MVLDLCLTHEECFQDIFFTGGYNLTVTPLMTLVIDRPIAQITNQPPSSVVNPYILFHRLV